MVLKQWTLLHISCLTTQTFKLQVRIMLADDCGKERNAALSSANMLLPSNQPTNQPPPHVHNSSSCWKRRENGLQKYTTCYVILKVFRYFPVWIRQTFQLLHVGSIYFIQVTWCDIFFQVESELYICFWLNEEFRREGDVFIIWLLFVIPKTQPSIHQLPSNHSIIHSTIQPSNHLTIQPSNLNPTKATWKSESHCQVLLKLQ